MSYKLYCVRPAYMPKSEKFLALGDAVGCVHDKHALGWRTVKLEVWDCDSSSLPELQHTFTYVDGKMVKA